MKNLLLAFIVVLFIRSDACFGQSTQPPSAVGREQPITIKKGDNVSPPRVVHTTNPKMLKNGIRGTVAIQGVVGTDGRLNDPSIKRSLSPQNDASALEAVKQWRFEPAKKDGKPVAVKTTVEVAFF